MPVSQWTRKGHVERAVLTPTPVLHPNAKGLPLLRRSAELPGPWLTLLPFYTLPLRSASSTKGSSQQDLFRAQLHWQRGLATHNAYGNGGMWLGGAVRTHRRGPGGCFEPARGGRQQSTRCATRKCHGQSTGQRAAQLSGQHSDTCLRSTGCCSGRNSRTSHADCRQHSTRPPTTPNAARSARQRPRRCCHSGRLPCQANPDRALVQWQSRHHRDLR